MVIRRIAPRGGGGHARRPRVGQGGAWRTAPALAGPSCWQHAHAGLAAGGRGPLQP